MKIRFQADNDLDQRIVVATKRLDPAIDFQTARALKLHGVPDTLVLKWTSDAAENPGFARPANAARILQGVHNDEYFAWLDHRFPEIASRKSSGTTAFALGRR
jgi:hypothetical protein